MGAQSFKIMEKQKTQKEIQAKLLEQCRYYKGEQTNPYTGNKGMAWAYEAGWVNLRLTEIDNTTIQGYITQYNKAGLGNYKLKDKAGLGLKALLFVKFTDANMAGVHEYKEWFEEYSK